MSEKKQKLVALVTGAKTCDPSLLQSPGDVDTWPVVADADTVLKDKHHGHFRKHAVKNEDTGMLFVPYSKFPKLHNTRYLRAALGYEVDAVPIWLHRQAGRYLRDFRAVRAEHDFFTVCQNPSLACEVTLQPLRKFALDASIIFCDILVIPQVMGLEVKMVKGKGPVLPEPIRTPKDLDRLAMSLTSDEIRNQLEYLMDALVLTRQSIKGRVPLIGFVGGPWTLMAYMIEGGGAKSCNRARSWFYRFPKAAERLLDAITDVCVHFLFAQVCAGAQALEVFESWAGDLPPGLFRKYVLPRLQSIPKRVRALQRQHLYTRPQGQQQTGKQERVHEPYVPMCLFPRTAHFSLSWFGTPVGGDGAPVQQGKSAKYVLGGGDGYDIISLDWSMEPETVRANTFPALATGSAQPSDKKTSQVFLSPSSWGNGGSDGGKDGMYYGCVPSVAANAVHGMVVQGNLDPAVMMACGVAPWPPIPLDQDGGVEQTGRSSEGDGESKQQSFAMPQVMKTEVSSMLRGFGTTGYICNLGHGMLPYHVPHGVEQLVNCVHAVSQDLVKSQQK